MAKSYVNMTFLTDNLKKATISIKNPRADVVDADIKTVMDTITTSNAFVTSAGTFIKKDSAKLVTIEEKEFVL